MRISNRLFGWVLASALLCAGLFPASGYALEASSAPVTSEWARGDVERAEALGLADRESYLWPEDYREPITRFEFQRVAMAFVALQANCDYNSLLKLTKTYLAEKDETGAVLSPFSDGLSWAGLSEAYYLGVVKGRGDGTFDPEGLISRQEAAVMLLRAYEAYSGEAPEGAPAPAYSDFDTVDAWAGNAVATLSQWGVMKGVEDGSFSPQDIYTTEQCLVTFLRLYELAPRSRARGNVAPLFSYDQCMEMMEGEHRDTLQNGYGWALTLRADGPRATFLRADLTGWGGRSASYTYFVYQEGGMKTVDLGLHRIQSGLTEKDTISNCSFDETGGGFRCTITFPTDVAYGNLEQEEPVVSVKQGHYFTTIDIDTLEYSHVWSPL